MKTAVATALLWWSAACIGTVHCHNWINNPPSRTPGLSKISPCPKRASDTSTSFVAVKGQNFALEWAIGHPNTYTWFTVVSRANEDKLPLVTETLLQDYVASAPPGASSKDPGGFLSDPIHDKVCVLWSAASGGFKEEGPLPTNMGDSKLQGRFTKKLSPGDSMYYERPSDWRCSRKVKGGAAACASRNVEVGLYEYKSQYHNTDERVSYASSKYPWIIAVYKYRHSWKRPQDYDLAQLALPSSAQPGEYVIQYLWRGYYDCFDMLLTSTTGGSPPTLISETKWVKEDHCQYKVSSGYTTWNKKKCVVLDADGDIGACQAQCDSGRGTAVNVVPLTNPPLVKFSSDVNIPFDNKNCKQSVLSQAAGNPQALVCYCLRPGPDPEVGEPFTVSDDPRDPVFYSSCWRKVTVTRLSTDPADTPTPTPDPNARWRFGDRCVPCADAVANSGVPYMSAPWWTVSEQCRRCS